MTTAAPSTQQIATAIRLNQVSKTYPNGPSNIAALNAVSLALEQGSFTAIMGPSGSGKSTLLNCAAGLEVPTTGHVVIGNTDLVGMNSDTLTRFRRENIGFVFQAYNLVDHLSVVENIQLPLLLGGVRPDLEWQRYLVDACGLKGFEQRLPNELSGGQAQRVAIARALMTRPTVVFADEPTGALDSLTGSTVMDVLRKTATSLGQTVVLVTHDPQVAAVADQVIFLADGHLVGQLVQPTTEQITARLLEAGQ
ncbi:MAG: ABC transporter ATP-binding protein [Nakamurella sp.]